MRRGIALIEVVVGAACVATLLVLLTMYGAEVRRNAGLGQSLANLNQYGTGIASYANEFDDRFPAFSWEPGERVESPWADIRAMVAGASGDSESHAAQAIHMMRAMGVPGLPLISGWIADVSYSHLPLLEFLNEDYRQAFVVSPADTYPRGWRSGTIQTPPGGVINERFRFYPSYEIPPTWWSPEEYMDGLEVHYRLVQASSQSSYMISSNTVFEGRFMRSVQFPAQKAMVYERFAWYYGPRVAFHCYPEARVPVLCADGSANVRVSGDANRGWLPNFPDRPAVTRVGYDPASWEPSGLSGPFSFDVVDGRMRWTRWGAEGRDFGPEVPPIP